MHKSLHSIATTFAVAIAVVSTVPRTQAASTVINRQILQLTNSHRTENGIAPLKENATLSGAAQIFAESLATQGFLSHVGADGSSPGSRIGELGYHWSRCAENIASGYNSSSAVMAGWMNSPGHRSNILNGEYREIGIGYAVAKDGTAYWVQDFGARF